jgi:hypothetical protein
MWAEGSQANGLMYQPAAAVSGSCPMRAPACCSIALIFDNIIKNKLMNTSKSNLLAMSLLVFATSPLAAQYCGGSQAGSASSFDWTAESWNVYIKPSATVAPTLNTIDSPYHPSNFTSQPNTTYIHSDPGEGDYHPDDGWALVAARMGLDAASAVRFPQFIIYNRFESKLRYFAYVADKVGIDQIQVEIRFSKGAENFTHVSAALEHVFTPMDVVDGYFDKGIIITTPNEYREQSGIWLMADIPIAYDPCTCQYGSMLSVLTRSIGFQNFYFTLEGGGDIVQIIDGEEVVNQNERFANKLGKLSEGVSKGNSAYKSASELIKVTENLLVNQANKKLTPDIREALIAGGFSGNDLTLDDVRSLWNQQQSGTASQELLNATKHLFPKKVSSVIPNWIKDAIPYANTAFALLDFIVGGGKSAPPKPMHFQADFQFVGQGVSYDSTDLDGMDFRVPGSKPVYQLLYAPVYDEVMGVLNLVEKPVLYQASEESFIYWEDEENQEENLAHVHEYSLMLSKPLRYALNPASGLDLSDIRASLQFKKCWFDNIAYPGQVLEEGVPGGLTDAGGGTWQTPYMPLSCLEHYSLKFKGSILNPLSFEAFSQCLETYLHLTAKLKPPGSVNETAFSALYHVDSQTAPYTFAQTPANPYLHIPNDLTVDRLEDVINGNLFSWNEITISQDITVTQQVNDYLSDKEPRGLIFVPGDPAAGTSGYVILEEIKEREIGTTIHAPFTVTNLPNCGDNDPVDAAWLAGFCADRSRYDPVLSIIADTPNEEPHSHLRVQTPTPSSPAARLLPNPAHYWAWLEYELPEGGYVSILVTDYLGRQALAVLQQGWQAAGAYRQAIPLGRLSPGWYYVSLVQAEGVQTLKLLKE